MKKTLRLILGDQLNIEHSWFKQKDEKVCYLMMESMQECTYVNHHIQKVVAFFLSMRSFAQTLTDRGHRLIYLQIDDKENRQSIEKNIPALIKKHGFECFEYQLPDEYRLDKILQETSKQVGIKTNYIDTEHFFTERNELRTFFEKKKSKHWLMESFYRQMRKKHAILVDEDGNPSGGKWNYDHSNRKKLPKNHSTPDPKLFEQNVSDLLEQIEKMKIKTIGSIKAKQFFWATDRKMAKELLSYFSEKCLPHFGDYQDAMAENMWSLYHSRLSFAMNVKLLSPAEVIQAVLSHYKKNKDSIHLSQVEGFVRQILGWREYMRGIYWAKMPEYANENQLEHRNRLPSFYWTGETKMNCMKNSIEQSLNYAYAHHIQRLMVTGNFALLANVLPEEVDEWYLGIYIDAIEWVELPNTRGMSQYADGGLIATKPYISSANYIKKMSNYCENCHYSSTKKVGEKACPFNSLYWHFIDQHLDKLKKNQRMSMMIANWNKQDEAQKKAILKQANYYLQNVEKL